LILTGIRSGGEARALALDRLSMFSGNRRRRLDRTAPELADLRPDWHRQKLLACALGHKACRDDRSVL
jgi:hypothetical protein